LPSDEIYEKGAAAVVARGVFAKPDLISGHKSLNYLENLGAKQEANQAGAFEAFLSDSNGDLFEGASSNLFAVIGQKIITPGSISGALPGITRKKCIENIAESVSEVIDRPIGIDELEKATEVFVTNSVWELVPIVRVDAQIMGDGTPGEIYKKLAKKYRELVNQYSSSPGTKF